MKEEKGWFASALGIVRWLQDLQMPLYAANAGYFIVLSIFPMLVLVLHLLHFTSLNAADLLTLMEGYLPDVLMPAAQKLVIDTYANTSTAMASVSALGALWSASRGVYGLLTGLNAIYGVQEDRGYLHTRFLSVVYTFGFLLVMLLTLGLAVFYEAALPEEGPTELLSGLLLLGLQIGMFLAIYTVLPNRKNSLRESLPGAVTAALGWSLLSRFFSVYVHFASGYANIFGSVYAVALGMLWLYSCLSIVFFGGGLNRLLAKEEKF